MHHLSMSCRYSLPASSGNSSASLAALLSSSSSRKLLCAQLLSKQEFGRAAVHRLPQATVSEQGKGHYCRQLFANHLQDSDPVSTCVVMPSPAQCLCCLVASTRSIAHLVNLGLPQGSHWLPCG